MGSTITAGGPASIDRCRSPGTPRCACSGGPVGDHGAQQQRQVQQAGQEEVASGSRGGAQAEATGEAAEAGSQGHCHDQHQEVRDALEIEGQAHGQQR